MTILYNGLGRFEDAAELEELRKQRFARMWPGTMPITDAMSCIGNDQFTTPGYVASRPRRPGESYAGDPAKND